MTPDSPDGSRCRIRVEPESAQSLIRFLLDRNIRLDPPEGGVARNPKYQVEMAGVPEKHSFSAFATAEELQRLTTEWRARQTPPAP